MLASAQILFNSAVAQYIACLSDTLVLYVPFFVCTKDQAQCNAFSALPE